MVISLNTEFRFTREFSELSLSCPRKLEVPQSHFGPDSYGAWSLGRNPRRRLGPVAYVPLMLHLAAWLRIASSQSTGGPVFEDDAIPVASVEVYCGFLTYLLSATSFGCVNLGRVSPPIGQTLRQTPQYWATAGGRRIRDQLHLKEYENLWRLGISRPQAICNQHVNMHAYFLSRRLANILLDRLRSTPPTLVPVDEYLVSISRIWELSVGELDAPICTISRRRSATDLIRTCVIVALYECVSLEIRGVAAFPEGRAELRRSEPHAMSRGVRSTSCHWTRGGSL